MLDDLHRDIPEDVVAEKRVGMWERIFGYLQRGQYVSANLALSLARGDHQVWDPIWKGIKGEQRGNYSEVLQELGMTNVPGKIDASDVLGFIGDVALDPTTYIGFGALTKTGKLAKSATSLHRAENLAAGAKKPLRETLEAILKVEDTKGPLADTVRKMLREGREDELVFGRTMAEQARKGQRSLLQFEAPKFRRTRVGGLPVPEITAARLKDFPIGSRAPRGIREIPIIVAPRMETVLNVPMPKELQAQAFQKLATLGQKARTTAGIGRVVNVLGKAFVPYFRPATMDPLVWEEFVDEIRVFQSGSTSGQADVFEKIREVGLRDDGILARMFRIPLPDEELTLLRRSIESPELLQSNKLDAAEEILLRTLDSIEPNVLPRLVEDSPGAAANARSRLLKRKEKIREAIDLQTSGKRPVDEEDLARLHEDLQNTDKALAAMEGQGPPPEAPPTPGRPPGPEPPPAPRRPPTEPTGPPPEPGAAGPRPDPSVPPPGGGGTDEGARFLEDAATAFLRGGDSAMAEVIGQAPDDVLRAAAQQAGVSPGKVSGWIRKKLRPSRSLVSPETLAEVPKVAPEGPATPFGSIPDTIAARQALVEQYVGMSERRAQIVAQVVTTLRRPEEGRIVRKGLNALEESMVDVLDAIKAHDDALVRSGQEAIQTQAKMQGLEAKVAELRQKPIHRIPAIETDPEAFRELDALEEARRSAEAAGDVKALARLDEKIDRLKKQTGADRIAEAAGGDLTAEIKGLEKAEEDFFQRGFDVRESVRRQELAKVAPAMVADRSGGRYAVKMRKKGGPAGDAYQVILHPSTTRQGYVQASRFRGDEALGHTEYKSLEEAIRWEVGDGLTVVDVELGKPMSERFGPQAAEVLAAAEGTVPISKAIQDVLGLEEAGRLARLAATTPKATFIEDIRDALQHIGRRGAASPFTDDLIDERTLGGFYESIRSSLGLEPGGDLEAALGTLGGVDEETILFDVAEGLRRQRDHLVALDPSLRYEPEDVNIVGSWRRGNPEGPIQVAFEYSGELTPEEIRFLVTQGLDEDEYMGAGLEVIPYRLAPGVTKEQMLRELTPGGMPKRIIPEQYEAFPSLAKLVDEPEIRLKPQAADDTAEDLAAHQATNLVDETPPPLETVDLPDYEMDPAIIDETAAEMRAREDAIAAIQEAVDSGKNPMSGRPLTDKQMKELPRDLRNLKHLNDAQRSEIEARFGAEGVKLLDEMVSNPLFARANLVPPRGAPAAPTRAAQIETALQGAEEKVAGLIEHERMLRNVGMDPKKRAKRLANLRRGAVDELARIEDQFGDDLAGTTRARLEGMQNRIRNAFPETDAFKPGRESPLEAKMHKPAKKPKAPRRPAVRPERKDTGDPIVDTSGWPEAGKRLVGLTRDRLEDLVGLQDHIVDGMFFDGAKMIPMDAQRSYESMVQAITGGEIRIGDAPTPQLTREGVALHPRIFAAEFHPEVGVVEITDTSGQVAQYHFSFRDENFGHTPTGERAVGVFDGHPNFQKALTAYTKKHGKQPFFKAAAALRTLKARVLTASQDDILLAVAAYNESVPEGLRILPGEKSRVDEGYVFDRKTFTRELKSAEASLRRRLKEYLELNPIERRYNNVVKKIKLKPDDVLGRKYQVPETVRKRHKAPAYGIGSLVEYDGRTGVVKGYRFAAEGLPDPSEIVGSKIRVVEFEDGTEVGLHIDEILVADLKHAADRGESLIQTFKRIMQDESGQIDLAGMQKLLTRVFKKDPALRRAMASEITDEIIRLRPELHHRRQTIITWFDGLAAREKDRNILRSFIDFYFPHVRYQDSKFKWLLGRGALRRRREFFEFMRTLEGTIDEINMAGFAGGRADPIFREEALLAMAVRGVAGERAVRTYDFIEKLTGQFGVPVGAMSAKHFNNLTAYMQKYGYSPEVIARAEALDSEAKDIIGKLTGQDKRGKKPRPITTKERVQAGKKILEDDAKELTKRLHMIEAELDQMVPEVGLYLPRGAFKKFPVKAIPADAIDEGLLDPEQMQAAMSILTDMEVKEGDYLVAIPLSKIRDVQAITKHVQGFLLPVHIADQVNATLRTHTVIGEDLRPFLSLYDAANSWFKKWTLTIFPQYHIRNHASDLINMSHGDFDSAHNLGRAWSFLSRKNLPVDFEGVVDGWGFFHTADNLEKDMKELGVLNRGFYAAEVETSLESEIGKTIWTLPFFGGDRNALLRAGQAFGTLAENHRRVAMYFDGLEKGLSPRAAAMRTKQFMFDFTELTGFERNVMRRLFPFYSWTRKNIPLQIRALLTRPGRFAALNKASESAERGIFPEPPNDNDLPPWMKDMAPVPVRRNPDGTVSYFVMGGWFPQADIYKLYDLPALAGGLLTPIIKAPIEFFTNYSLFFGDKVERYPQQTGEFLGLRMRKRWVNLARNLRLLNTVDRFIWDKDLPMNQRTANLFVGRLYPVDFDKEREYRKYAVGREVSALKQAVKKHQENLDKDIEAGRPRVFRNEGVLSSVQRELARQQAELDRLERLTGATKGKSKIRFPSSGIGVPDTTSAPLQNVPAHANPRSLRGGFRARSGRQK